MEFSEDFNTLSILFYGDKRTHVFKHLMRLKFNTKEPALRFLPDLPRRDVSKGLENFAQCYLRNVGTLHILYSPLHSEECWSPPLQKLESKAPESANALWNTLTPVPALVGDDYRCHAKTVRPLYGWRSRNDKERADQLFGSSSPDERSVQTQ